jgi:tRNA modification GTPase
LDLTEAEGLIDLINAQTEQQRKQSLYQMQGSLKDLYERWRTDLVKVQKYQNFDLNFCFQVFSTRRSLYRFS